MLEISISVASLLWDEDKDDVDKGSGRAKKKRQHDIGIMMESRGPLLISVAWRLFKPEGVSRKSERAGRRQRGMDRDERTTRVPDSERETHPRAAGYVLSGYLHARIRGSDTPTRIMHVVIESEKGGPER